MVQGQFCLETGRRRDRPSLRRTRYRCAGRRSALAPGSLRTATCEPVARVALAFVRLFLRHSPQACDVRRPIEIGLGAKEVKCHLKSWGEAFLTAAPGLYSAAFLQDPADLIYSGGNSSGRAGASSAASPDCNLSRQSRSALAALSIAC